MSFLGRFVGGGGNGAKEERGQKIEAIERLCNTLKHASLLEDRRAAAQSLESASKHYRLEVGMVAIPSLLAAIQRDAEDMETTKYILEIFLQICGGIEDAIDVEGSHTAIATAVAVDGNKEVGTVKGATATEFCEIILKDDGIVPLLIEDLKNETLYLRYNILQLLQIFSKRSHEKLISSIMSPGSGAISVLVDLIGDDREVIRNELLLLLIDLTKTNAQIQRIAVLEGAIEKLWGLVEITDAGLFSSDVLVEDCLKTVKNLLNYNPFNQNYFRESESFPKLTSILAPKDLPLSKVKWTTQTCKNVVAFLDLFSILCYQEHPKLNAVQGSMIRIKIIDPILAIISILEIPISVKAAALRALACLLWKNLSIQNTLAHAIFPSSFLNARPCPTILLIIKTALEPSISSELQLAALFCIDAYLIENKEGQIVIASTFKSPRVDGSPSGQADLSAGSIIIDALLDLHYAKKHSHRTWYAALLMCHVIRDNEQCKQLSSSFRTVSHTDVSDKADGEEDEIAELFQKILSLISEALKDDRLYRETIGYLILLCTWLRRSPQMVAKFMCEGSNVQLLIELFNQNSVLHPILQASAAILFSICLLDQPAATAGASDERSQFTQKSLLEIVKNRIGIDVFLCRISRLKNRILQFKASTLVEGNKDAADFEFDNRFAELALEVCQDLNNLLNPIEAGTRRDISIETNQPLAAEQPASNPTLKNMESKCQYLVMENDRLQKLTEAYSRQILEIEKEHGEMIVTLLSYEQELKELKDRLGMETVTQKSLGDAQLTSEGEASFFDSLANATAGSTAFSLAILEESDTRGVTSPDTMAGSEEQTKLRKSSFEEINPADLRGSASVTGPYSTHEYQPQPQYEDHSHTAPICTQHFDFTGLSLNSTEVDGLAAAPLPPIPLPAAEPIVVFPTQLLPATIVASTTTVSTNDSGLASMPGGSGNNIEGSDLLSRLRVKKPKATNTTYDV